MNHVRLELWCTQLLLWPPSSHGWELIKISPRCFDMVLSGRKTQNQKGASEGPKTYRIATGSPPSSFNQWNYDFSVVRAWWIINQSKLIFIVCGKHQRVSEDRRTCLTSLIHHPDPEGACEHDKVLSSSDFNSNFLKKEEKDCLECS